MKGGSGSVDWQITHLGLLGIAQGMAAELQRRSRSQGLAERRDLAAAVLSLEGELLANYCPNPLHLAPLALTANQIRLKFAQELRSQDIFLCNDPYSGGSIIPCMTMLMVATEEEGSGLLLAVRGRHRDAGGAAPGGIYPLAHEVVQEGDRVPPIRLGRGGRPQRDIWRRLLKNNRLPHVYDADLSAMVGALEWGHRQAVDFLSSINSSALVEALSRIGLWSRQRTLHSLEKCSPGRGEVMVAIPGVEGTQRIEAAVFQGDSGPRLSLQCSTPQATGPFNSPLANTVAWATVVDQDPLPGGYAMGMAAAPETDIPEGTLLNPKFPAPTGLCHLLAGPAIREAARRATAASAEGPTSDPRPPTPLVLLVEDGSNEIRARGLTPCSGEPFATFYRYNSWCTLSPLLEPDLLSAEMAELDHGIRVVSLEMEGGHEDTEGAEATLSVELTRGAMDLTAVVVPFVGAQATPSLLLETSSGDREAVDGIVHRRPLAVGDRITVRVVL